MIFPFITPVYASSTQDVVIRQVLPNPTGDDTETEWIELENTSSNTVSLTGWMLGDGYGSVSTFSLDGLTILAHAFLTLLRPDTGIVLNNDAEKVILKNALGVVFETGIMSKSPEGKAYIFKDGVWEWGEPIAHADTIPFPFPTPSPTPSSVPTPSSSPTQTSQSAQRPPVQVELNEIMACGSSPEWVELKNLSQNSVVLDGWSLSSGKVSMLKLDGVRIEPNALYTAWLPGFYLKNTEDAVKLLEKGALRDQFQYDSCDPQASWSRDDGGHWYATQTVTQGTPNLFESKPQHSPKQQSSVLVKKIVQTDLQLPEVFLELPQSLSSMSAVLGVTSSNVVREVSYIPPLLLVVSGACIVASQYKTLSPISKSFQSLFHATIERI